MKPTKNFTLLATFCLSMVMSLSAADQQGAAPISKSERQMVQDILKEAADDISKNYYDPKFHGIDLEARVRDASEKVSSAQSLSQAYAAIADLFDGFNDSHTAFIPPRPAVRIQKGFEARYVGESYFVTSVMPGSDAEKQGLKRGDEILAMDGFACHRQDEHKLAYLLDVLAPRYSMKLLVRSLDAKSRDMLVHFEKKELPTVMDLRSSTRGNTISRLIRDRETYEESIHSRYAEVGRVLVWKLPVFGGKPESLDSMIGKMKKAEGVVLDLRGNPGGLEEPLIDLLSALLDHEVKVVDRITRKATKPLIVKPTHSPFTGKVAVLIDSASASASELFARVIQLEKRGMVMGDRSSGQVMEGMMYPHYLGIGIEIFYAFEVTIGDLVMADGKSLEHNGVVPDMGILPSAKELAAGLDPAMAIAIAQVGGTITADAAGKLFPPLRLKYEW